MSHSHCVSLVLPLMLQCYAKTELHVIILLFIFVDSLHSLFNATLATQHSGMVHMSLHGYMAHVHLQQYYNQECSVRSTDAHPLGYDVELFRPTT